MIHKKILFVLYRHNFAVASKFFKKCIQLGKNITTPCPPSSRAMRSSENKIKLVRYFIASLEFHFMCHLTDRSGQGVGCSFVLFCFVFSFSMIPTRPALLRSWGGWGQSCPRSATHCVCDLGQPLLCLHRPRFSHL